MILVEAATRSGNSYEFTIPEGLQEITLARFVTYQNEVDLHMPESMRAYYDADKDKREELLKQIPLSDITVLWFDFYIKAVKYWCRLSDEQVAELSHDEVLYIYNIINNHLFSFEYNESLRSFTFKGQEYLYPDRKSVV